MNPEHNEKLLLIADQKITKYLEVKKEYRELKNWLWIFLDSSINYVRGEDNNLAYKEDIAIIALEIIHHVFINEDMHQGAKLQLNSYSEIFKQYTSKTFFGRTASKNGKRVPIK